MKNKRPFIVDGKNMIAPLVYVCKDVKLFCVIEILNKRQLSLSLVLFIFNLPTLAASIPTTTHLESLSRILSEI